MLVKTNSKSKYFETFMCYFHIHEFVILNIVLTDSKDTMFAVSFWTEVPEQGVWTQTGAAEYDVWSGSTLFATHLAGFSTHISG